MEGSDSGKEESAKSNAALTGEAVVDSLMALIGSKKTTGAKRSSGDDKPKGTKKSKKQISNWRGVHARPMRTG